jgi:hypothetical protein
VSAEAHVRRWLASKQTGCGFATQIAKAAAGLTMATFPGVASAAEVDAVFDYAAIQSRPAIVVLPGLRTEAVLADQLLALALGARWRVQVVDAPAGLTTDDVFVSIEWLTSAPDKWSSPMGLAPFGTMPATRRAPYTCVAAWTGGHANKFRKRVEPVVHFLDVDLSAYRMSAERYNERRKSSVEATSAILFDDDARNYRNVAYRLSRGVAEQLAPLRR